MTIITTEAALALADRCNNSMAPDMEAAEMWLTEAGQMLETLVRERDELQRLRDIEARYHWLCAHLTQIHVETTQPAGSPEDAPMRVTLIQAWPGLPETDAGSVDAAVGEAMKEGA